MYKLGMDTHVKPEYDEEKDVLNNYGHNNGFKFLFKPCLKVIKPCLNFFI